MEVIQSTCTMAARDVSEKPKGRRPEGIQIRQISRGHAYGTTIMWNGLQLLIKTHKIMLQLQLVCAITPECFDTTIETAAPYKSTTYR